MTALTNLSQQVGIRLRAARKAASYRTAREFAQGKQIPESTYSQHETGSRCLNVDLLVQYGELLEVNAGWLLTGQGQPYGISNPEAEKILRHELKNLSDDQFLSEQPISGTETTVVDMGLFQEILLAIAPMFADNNIELSYQELIGFCIDIYNSIITTSADKESRSAMIQLSVSSLKRGIIQKQQNRNEQHIAAS